MSHWIGCCVSVHCGDTLGVYQGKITEVTNSTIILTKAFRNGLPYPKSDVTLNCCDIKNIQIIEIEPKSEPESSGRSVITVAKPIPKRATKPVNTNTFNSTGNNANDTSYTINKSGYNGGVSPVVTSTPVINRFNKPTSPNNNELFVDSEGNRKDANKIRTKYRKGWKDEACFGTPLDKSFQKDFDFEKNLALFNKQAIWDELNAAQRPDVVRHADKRVQQNMKYRHDENVIATLPTVFREIEVSGPDRREYVTDSGLIVPSLMPELRLKLFSNAEQCGFTFERRAEIIGRAATEMVLQLLGGGYRLNPHNTHQAPTVVALCGQNKSGAIGLNALRQLVSHNVKTVAYLTNQHLTEEMSKELNLYRLTDNKYTCKVLDLPSSVDLIILALCDEESASISTSTSYPLVTEWINQNRAPVLALDPPANGTPGIVTKFSLVPVLPLAYSSDNGNIYLCNLGIPSKVFNETRIKYKSPFGSKFVIPLHPNT